MSYYEYPVPRFVGDGTSNLHIFEVITAAKHRTVIDLRRVRHFVQGPRNIREHHAIYTEAASNGILFWKQLGPTLGQFRIGNTPADLTDAMDGLEINLLAPPVITPPRERKPDRGPEM